MVPLPFLAILKQALFGLARGTRDWGRRPPLLFSSCVFDISSFAPPRKAPATQSMIGFDEGTSAGTFMRVSKHGMNLSGTHQGLGR